MDRGAWWATVHGVTKTQTHLSDLAGTQALWQGQSGSSDFITTRGVNAKREFLTITQLYSGTLLFRLWSTNFTFFSPTLFSQKHILI